MARAGVTNGFAADAVLLRREGERGKCGGVQVGRGGSQRCSELAATNPQANVLEAEEIIGGSLGEAGIFAWA